VALKLRRIILRQVGAKKGTQEAAPERGPNGENFFALHLASRGQGLVPEIGMVVCQTDRNCQRSAAICQLHAGFGAN